MNVLIFVMTLLMLLSLMTYARLDSYRSSQTFQIIFKYYMENDERGYINLQAKPTYNSITVKTNADKPKKGPKVEGSPRIGVIQLLDKKIRDSKPKEWFQTQILLKNLMRSLYEKQPFFESTLESNPALLDELIASIVNTVDALPKDQKLKAIKDIANLKLTDPQLDQILYKFLQGSPCKVLPLSTTAQDKEIKVKVEEAPKEQLEDKSQAEPIPEEAQTEFQSPKGYCSLLDFITAESTPKVRIYLASREVLSAIFHDPGVVNEIIAERKQLYKQAIGDEDTKELSNAFKDRFDRLKDSAISEESVSYDVTKTNPKDYE